MLSTPPNNVDGKPLNGRFYLFRNSTTITHSLSSILAALLKQDLNYSWALLLSTVIVFTGGLVFLTTWSRSPHQAASQVQQTTLTLPLPPQTTVRTPPPNTWHVIRVLQGQTLSKLFAQLHLSPRDLERLLSYKDSRKFLTHLPLDSKIAFDIPQPGQLRAMRYDRDDNHQVELTFHQTMISERHSPRPATSRLVTTGGSINRSLWTAAHQAGLTAADVSTLADEIFKYDIDFNSDLREGDRFSLVLEESWRDGERAAASTIHAASFMVRGKTFIAIRYVNNGHVGYFDPQGRPLKKSFIRMPIPFARLTSTFGTRRHPVLGKIRMHKGVDYAAAIGTPIMAAGDAKVRFVGVQRGYGNVVILNHGHGYSTLYGHMSRFGKIKPGQFITQGRIIGYVGMTGLATGPHLHYEFRINDQHRDPLSVTMPPAEPLSGQALAAFRSQTATIMAQLRYQEQRLIAKDDHESLSNPMPQSHG